MSYRVDLPRKQQRALDVLPVDVRARISHAIERLADQPRPPGAKKLQGSPLWRIRVGDYRVIYGIFDKIQVVTVSKILRRTTHTYD